MKDRTAFHDRPFLRHGSFSRTNSVVFWIKRRQIKEGSEKTSIYNLQKVQKIQFQI